MHLLKTSILTLIVLTAQQSIAQDNVFKLDEKYPIEANGTIYMDTDDANVRIMGSDRKDVRVNIYRKLTRKGIVFGDESFEVEIKPRGGNLYIKDIQQQVSIGVMGYMSEEYEIKIEAPNTVNLDVDGDDDDYTIRDINGSIAMDLDDGDARLIGCSGSSFDFRLDDGDLEMDEARGSLRISVDDGDVQINNAKLNEIDAIADDGDIEIATTLVDNGNYSFRADDGDIILTVLGGGGTFHIYHDDGRVSASQAFRVLKQEDDETKLQLGDGNATVKVRADDSNVRLREI